MSAQPGFIRIPSLKTPEAFRAHAASLGLDLPCDDSILVGAASPLAREASDVRINGKVVANRWAVQPMEGWDGTTSGGITEDVVRRWQRFGESGAKLICGGEAMAVCPEGRANPRQLIINEANQTGLAHLCQVAREAHARHAGRSDDLVIGFQLTHSGRFCRPEANAAPAPRVAFRHPILDRRFRVERDDQVLRDEEIAGLIRLYVAAARIAWRAGADFVDLKHCHGYLLHEFLGAHQRPPPYGGSFENRTRILRELVAGIRADGNPIDIGVRLSAFDVVPYRPDPERSVPGRPGPGIPEPFAECLPYRFGFGVHPDRPMEPDLAESFEFMELCRQLGVKILNLTAGSPYYNPHIQRPAAYPPIDGYLPPEDPLVGVARQVQAARALKARAPADMLLIGSAYSYLQDYLPHVAQAVLRQDWIDIVGIGRSVLSYPRMLADAVQHGRLESKLVCRTFSDCTTAPRNGLVSGCYPLDRHYAGRAEAATLKSVKRGNQ